MPSAMTIIASANAFPSRQQRHHIFAGQIPFLHLPKFRCARLYETSSDTVELDSPIAPRYRFRCSLVVATRDSGVTEDSFQQQIIHLSAESFSAS